MLSLYKRFENPVIFTSGENEVLNVPLGSVRLNAERALQLEMYSGGSCGLGDDVYAFAGDEHGVWYITYKDYLKGQPWVYCVFFKDIRLTLKGIINDDGCFCFVDGADVIFMDKEGNTERACSVGDMGFLIGYDSSDDPLTLTQINRVVSVLCEREECSTDVYTDMVNIHRVVDNLAYSNNLESVSVSDLVRAVIEVLTLANKAGIDIQPEIIRQLEMKLQSKGESKIHSMLLGRLCVDTDKNTRPDGDSFHNPEGDLCLPMS